MNSYHLAHSSKMLIHIYPYQGSILGWNIGVPSIKLGHERGYSLDTVSWKNQSTGFKRTNNLKCACALKPSVGLRVISIVFPTTNPISAWPPVSSSIDRYKSRKSKRNVLLFGLIMAKNSTLQEKNKDVRKHLTQCSIFNSISGLSNSYVWNENSIVKYVAPTRRLRCLWHS